MKSDKRRMAQIQISIVKFDFGLIYGVQVGFEVRKHLARDFSLWPTFVTKWSWRCIGPTSLYHSKGANYSLANVSSYFLISPFDSENLAQSDSPLYRGDFSLALFSATVLSSVCAFFMANFDGVHKNRQSGHPKYSIHFF